MQTLKTELIRLASFTAKVVIVSVLFLGTAALAVALFSDELNDNPYDNKRTISVQGVAKKKIAPDSARVTLGKNIRGKDPVVVQNDATTAINKLVAEVKKLGVPDEKIETSNYSLTPLYNATNDIESYSISISVTVTLEKTNPKDGLANKVIAAGTTSGINEVRGLSFFLSNKEELQRDMEDEAIKDAKEQAKKRAKAAGLKLGDVLSIGGSNFYYYGADGMRSETGVSAPSAVPAPDRDTANRIDIKPGELEIRESVTLVFEVK